MGDNMERLSFIGGIADGQVREVRKGETGVTVEILRRPAKPISPMFEDGSVAAVFSRDHYERAMLEQYTGERGSPSFVHDKVHFFRLRGMTENDAVRRLIECYRP